MAAVKRTRWALKYASNELKYDNEVVTATVVGHWSTVCFKEDAVAGFKGNLWPLTFAPDELKCDIDGDSEKL